MIDVGDDYYLSCTSCGAELTRQTYGGRVIWGNVNSDDGYTYWYFCRMHWAAVKPILEELPQLEEADL